VDQFEKYIPSAAEAGCENKALVAAVNRCATQRQEQRQRQEVWWTLSWNPTLAQKTRKDGAPLKPRPSKRIQSEAQAERNIDFRLSHRCFTLTV